MSLDVASRQRTGLAGSEPARLVMEGWKWCTRASPWYRPAAEWIRGGLGGKERRTGQGSAVLRRIRARAGAIPPNKHCRSPSRVPNEPPLMPWRAGG